MLYPVQGVTLHRVAAGQRSQGDGEEQALISSPQLQESGKILLQSSTKSKITHKKTIKEIIHNVEAVHKLKEDVELENSVMLPVLGKETSHNIKRTNKYLPEVADIALKLTKVSIMSAPDTYLLNTPPKNLNKERIIPLIPRSQSTGSLSCTRERASNIYSKKRKDPKFVPYEPYKGCVKPILSKKNKMRNKESISETEVSEQEANNTCVEKTSAVSADNDDKNAEKMSILVKDFEEERAAWEKNTSILNSEKKKLEDQLSQIKKEKSILESQLSVQSQVNTELKKLLVASVGEDVQGRVQCLTEDKARMATMIRHYSERVDRDYEEKERMGIQCDVWRSKFLGSSMLVDDLVSCKVTLMRKLEEAEEALRVVIDEHDLARQHVLNMYRMNKQLRDAFDPLAAQSGGVPSLASADLVTLAVDGDVLAETVRDRLLGDLGRSVGCFLSLEGLETQTPGEKMARQACDKTTKNLLVSKIRLGVLQA